MTTHRAAQHPTLPKCQRTVNFPPDSKLQASPPPCDYVTFHSAGQWPRGHAGPAHRARAVQSGPRGASSCVSWLARGSRRPRLPLGRARAIFRALYKRAGALSASSLLTETRKWSSVRVSDVRPEQKVRRERRRDSAAGPRATHARAAGRVLIHDDRGTFNLQKVPAEGGSSRCARAAGPSTLPLQLFSFFFFLNHEAAARSLASREAFA